MTTPRILIVDDNEDTSTSLVELLESEDLAATAVNSVNAAIDMDGHWDLMIVDLGFPSTESGMGFVENRLRHGYDKNDFVLMSASRTKAMEARTLGFTALVKPFDVEDFVVQVQKKL
jgi:DNA-binding response OmpR family regulator